MEGVSRLPAMEVLTDTSEKADPIQPIVLRPN